MINKYRVDTQETNNFNLEEFERKRVCDDKKCIEVIGIKNTNRSSNSIRKIDNEKYVYIPTGEVRYYNRNLTRKECKTNLIKTFTKIKRIINYNFNGSKNAIHIILTYKELMLEPSKLSNDFKSFWNKIKYKYNNLEYLRIAEPQESGSWHLHILVKDVKSPYLFIPYEFIRECWGRGNIKVVRIKNVDRMSTYFFPSFKETASKKAKEKAERLKYYPKGFNIYRASKGLYRPKFIDMTLGEINKLVDDCKLTYSAISNIKTIDEKGDEVLLNQIVKRQYIRNKHSVNRVSKPELSGERKEVDE